MAGQLELRDKLLEPRNKGIKRRIFAPSLLDPLTFSETIKMISFRCEKGEIDNPFTEDAVKAIYEASNGVPGDILRVCAIAYDFMLQSDQRIVTPELVNLAARGAN